MSKTLSLLDLLRLTTLRRLARPAAAAPNPTERLRLIPHEEVDRHRDLACGRYEVCLDAAYQRGWRSWSCVRCERFSAPRRPSLARLGGRRLRPQLAGGGSP